MLTAKKLYNIIIGSNPRFIEEADSIEIDDSEIAVDLNSLYTVEKIHGNKIRIEVNQQEILIYWDIKDFYLQASKKCLQKDILIISDENKQALYFNSASKITYQHFNISTSDYLLENAYYYFKTLEVLKEQEHKEDYLFYFVDHFNESFRKIIFTSLNKQGKLTVSYPIGIPNLNRAKSFKEPCEQLFKAFTKENKNLPKFIKNELFKSLSAESPDERIIKLFENLSEILLVAEQNFELYLNDLSLEKFRTDYIEYKEKYFSQLRDILGKISTQVVALPLSITAAAFATYRTTDKPLLFILVTIAFLIFTIYSFFLIRLYKFDVLDIERNFLNDFDKLSKEEYFIKYPDELSVFDRVKESIVHRVTNLKNLIFAYTFLLSITNSLFILFACLQKGMYDSKSYTIASLSLLVFCILLNFLVWKINDRENA